jgi:hypothetical protein
VRSFAEIPGAVARRVADGERIALILLDALGRELLMRERDHPLVGRLSVEPFLSQFPSTTAAHVTTMHTGLPVESHGLYGWRVFEPAIGEVIVPLRFRRDASAVEDELDGRLDPRALVASPTLYEQLGRRSIVVEPAAWLRATPSVEAWNLGQHGGRADDETATYLARVRT